MAKSDAVHDPLALTKNPRLDLPVLAEAARSCQACPLYRNATQTVFGAGPLTARMVLVGEQPGDEEDRKGQPFVGPAGRMLDQILVDAGITRDELYVTNAVKHFKFVMQGKRRLHEKPKTTEVRACQPWVLGEIERLRPQVLVALGATAVESLFGKGVGVLRDRGHAIASPLAPFCFVTYHPSAALRARTPEDRAKVRAALTEDLRAAAAHLAQAARKAPRAARQASGVGRSQDRPAAEAQHAHPRATDQQRARH
jgi:uracil-DNA glycosylase family protein